MALRIKKICLIFIFLGAVFLPILCLNREEGKISATEKRYLASFPKLFDENGKLILDGLTEKLEDWLNDNLGMRDTLVELYTNILVKGLHLTTNNKVEIGKDGWYFYTGDGNMKIADGTYPLTSDDINKSIELQQRINNKLKVQGREYVLIFTPAQTSIYPEMIRTGNYEVTETPIDIMEDAFLNNTDIHTIALKDIMLEKKEEEQIFFKTDTHWNWVGAYAAYQEVIRNLNAWEIISAECEQVTTYDSEYLGEMGAMLGNATVLGEEKVLKTRIVEQNAVAITDGFIIDEINNLTNKPWNSIRVFQNESSDGKVAVMFGDSKFAFWNMPELLAEHFTTFVYVWGGGVNQEIIDIVNPDLVLFDIGERYLNCLDSWSVSFAQSIHKLENPSAIIVSETTPKIVESNVIDEILITVRNTGTEQWTGYDKLGLAIWINEKDTYRVKIPENIVVLPGEEYTFSFQNLQLNDNFYTRIDYQMVQEGVTYFATKKYVPVVYKENIEWKADIVSVKEIQSSNSSKLEVQVKNTSNFVWCEDYRIRLAIFEQGKDIARAYISDSQLVHPGETYTFYTETEWTEEQLKNLSCQMAMEGIIYFGERESVR